MLLPFFLLFVGAIFSDGAYGFQDKKSDRIVGGRRVSVVSLPYQAQLLQNNIQICGATILSTTWVLTAAHCIDKSSPKWTVLTGSDDASFGGDNHELRRSPIVHPYYNRETTDNDIALLELATPIMFNERQKPIPLSPRVPRVGDKVTVSGFGKLGPRSDDPYAEKLMVAMVPVIDENICRQRYFPEPITDNMFCAISYGEVDTCQGDSGGPAVVNNELVGVVSFGKVCASSEHPGVYTKVYNYIDWILSNTQSTQPQHVFQQVNHNHFNVMQSSIEVQTTQRPAHIPPLVFHRPTHRPTSLANVAENAHKILQNILTGRVHITFN